MDLSIFRGSALNFIMPWFHESMFMNIINIGNVESAVKSSTWTFMEPGTPPGEQKISSNGTDTLSSAPSVV